MILTRSDAEKFTHGRGFKSPEDWFRGARKSLPLHRRRIREKGLSTERRETRRDALAALEREIEALRPFVAQ